MRIIFFFIILYSSVIYSHQPKLIKNSPSIEKPHHVIDPEISKAYYAKLTGEPHYYKIESNKPDPIIKSFFEKAKKFWKNS